jgi:lysozyme
VLKPALVMLSDDDTDAPVLPGIATVSKDHDADGGAYAHGAALAGAGNLWVDRAYFTGRPDQDWVVAKCRRVTEAGGYFQYGNEPNHPDEHWDGPPVSYSASFVLARMAYPEGRWLYAPPSPGLDGWRDWVPTGDLDLDYAVHCYGSFARMREVVAWYLDSTAGDLFVTECNPGAGNTFDLNHWAWNDLHPFLDWCATESRVRMVAYFAWRWDQSPRLPSSVDAAGTAVESVLRAWIPPPQEVPVPVLTGVDISNNQGAVDLGLVKAAGNAFVAIKASGDEGRGNVFLDPFFPENWHQANAHELVRIAYHYARPSAVTPAQSVTTLERALQAVGGLKVGDNVALDVEDPEVPEGVSLHVWVAEWLALAEQVFQVAPYRYSAHYYTSTHDLEHEDLARYPVWWASYQAIKPAPSRGWAPIRIWQNSASGRVPGVGGDVDTDLFEGTREELLALGKLGLPELVEPAVPPYVVSALDWIWSEIGPDIEAQKAVAKIKEAIGLQRVG